MSTPQIPPPAKLVVSVILSPQQEATVVERALREVYGEMDYRGERMPFDFTDYYQAEMGTPLVRYFFAVENLVPREALAPFKLSANELEKKFSPAGRRQVNIDPGLLTPENFILATGKNYAHRIYLRDGIFADLTYIYRQGSYQPLPWTYPDYASAAYIALFNELRRRLLKQLSTWKENQPRHSP